MWVGGGGGGAECHIVFNKMYNSYILKSGGEGGDRPPCLPPVSLPPKDDFSRCPHCTTKSS